jgi:hypothetical protein
LQLAILFVTGHTLDEPIEMVQESYLDCQPLLPHLQGPILNIDMSDPPSGKQSKKSLLRLLTASGKDLFSRHNRSPPHRSDNATASIPASPRNNATSAPQVNPQGAEYAAILELSTTPSTPLTCQWEYLLKECGSTTYEGLKFAIQGIYDCSGLFPPLQTTAALLLTTPISMVVDVSGSLCSTCKYSNNVSTYPSESFSE